MRVTDDRERKDTRCAYRKHGASHPSRLPRHREVIPRRLEHTDYPHSLRRLPLRMR
jgi:hypothetical protein